MTTSATTQPKFNNLVKLSASSVAAEAAAVDAPQSAPTRAASPSATVVQSDNVAAEHTGLERTSSNGSELSFYSAQSDFDIEYHDAMEQLPGQTSARNWLKGALGFNNDVALEKPNYLPMTSTASKQTNALPMTSTLKQQMKPVPTANAASKQTNALPMTSTLKQHMKAVPTTNTASKQTNALPVTSTLKKQMKLVSTSNPVPKAAKPPLSQRLKNASQAFKKEWAREICDTKAFFKLIGGSTALALGASLLLQGIPSMNVIAMAAGAVAMLIGVYFIVKGFMALLQDPKKPDSEPMTASENSLKTEVN